MPAYSRLVGPLCLLACLLTAAASGDDFCLLRLLCPATAAAADPLPLDDPNTDFLSAAKSGAGHRSDGGAGGDGSPADSGPAFPPLLAARRFAPPAAGWRLPRAGSNVPLRC